MPVKRNDVSSRMRTVSEGRSLSPDVLAVLGDTSCDGAAAADLLGWSPGTVRNERSRLGISLRAAKHDHDARTLEVLTDTSIPHRRAAEILGTTRSKVRTRRANLGIDRAAVHYMPAFEEQNHKVLQNQALTHREAGEKLGLTRAQVKTMRSRLSIDRSARRRPGDDVLAAAVADGRSDEQIAETYGVRPDTVRVWRADIDLYRRPWARPSAANLQDFEGFSAQQPSQQTLAHLVASGLTNREIAQVLGVSPAVAKQRLGAADIRRPAPADIDLGEVRRLKAQALTDAEIGDLLGMSASRILRARKRNSIPAQGEVLRPSPRRVMKLTDDGCNPVAIMQLFRLDPDAASTWIERARHAWLTKPLAAKPAAQSGQRPLARTSPPNDDHLEVPVGKGHTDTDVARPPQVSVATLRRQRRRAPRVARNGLRPTAGQFQRLVDRGLSDRDIADELGVAPSTASSWRREAGVHRPPPGSKNPGKEVLSGLVSEGLSDTSIAQRFGVTRSTASQWRRVAGLQPGLARSTHPGEKQLVALVTDGFTDGQIAERYAVAEATAATWRRAAGISRSRRAPSSKIVELLAKGLDDETIANMLGLSPGTVAGHRRDAAWTDPATSPTAAPGRTPKGPGARSNPRWGRHASEVTLEARAGRPAHELYGILGGALLAMSPRDRSSLGNIVGWLRDNHRWPVGEDELAVAAYVVAAHRAGRSLPTITDHLMALRHLQEATGAVVTTGAAHATIRRIRASGASWTEPCAPVTPLRVLRAAWVWDWTMSPRNVLRISSATLMAAHPELRHPMARIGRFRPEFVTFFADSAEVNLPATERREAVRATVSPHADARGEPWRCPVAALRRLVGTERPALVRDVKSAGAYRRELLSDLACRAWLAITFQNALRSGTIGRATIEQLHKPAFQLRAKGGLVDVTIAHTIDHELCPSCAVRDLLRHLPRNTPASQRLGTLATTTSIGSWFAARVAEVSPQASGMTPNTLRRSMASIVYQRTGDLFAVARLLQHRSDLGTTARYVEALPNIGDLTDLDYPLPVWEEYLANTARVEPKRAGPLEAFTSVVNEAVEHLKAAGHSSVGQDGRPQAVAARRQYREFCDGTAPFDFPNGWWLDPEDPQSLQRFIIHYLFQRSNRVATVEAKVAHVLDDRPLQARQAFKRAVAPILRGAKKRERAERMASHRAPLVTREMATGAAQVLLAENDLLAAGRIILGWNAALRPSSLRGVNEQSLTRFGPRATLAVRVATKRRGATNRHAYTVTLEEQNDALCPIQWLDRMAATGTAVDYERSKSRDHHAWLAERAVVTESMPGWGRVTPMSLRHGRAVEHYTQTMNIVGTQVLLGHQSPARTMTYLVHLSARIRSAVVGDLTAALGIDGGTTVNPRVGAGLWPLSRGKH